MKHLLTCCELPKCLLDREDKLNDYDFVLYHQYLKDETYRNHYLSKRQFNPDRIMILDNSAYEFFMSGEQFIKEDFIRVILELKPTYYIIPDVLMNSEKTLNNFYEWVDNIIEGITCSSPFIVPQGKTLDEFTMCMKTMHDYMHSKNIIANFCIPFHNDFFADGSLYDTRLMITFFGRNNYDELTKDEKYALGRMVLMDYVADIYKEHIFHMLGSHCPVEIRLYNVISNIKTFDSGYPVKLAIEGIRFGEEKSKPNIIIDDFYGQELHDDVKSLIIYNINKMRDLI